MSLLTVLVINKGESRIDNWLINHDLRAGRYAVKDFNFETPSNSLLSKIDSSTKLTDSHAYELYEYPGGYEKRDEGEKYVRMRMEEEEVEHATIYAEGNCRHFNPGFRFELTEHNRRDQNKAYVLTSVTHSASIGGNFPDLTGPEDHHYRNRFTCIPASVPFRPNRYTPKPIVRGTQTAIVVGPSGEEIHTDKYGRVKVQFHWDRRSKANEDSSCWIRVASSWAGKNWGMIAIPRIGQEVIVDFLEGDPDRPISIGRVYNAEQMPPYELPAEMTKSTMKSNASKGGGGFNEFRFEDKKGSEQVFLHAERDQDIRVKNDSMEWIGKDRHLIIKADQLEKVEGDKHLTIQGDQNEKVNGVLSQDIAMDLQQKVGMKHALDAGTEIHLKAGMNLVIEAGANLTLKVGGNFVNLNPSGVYIQGAMVFINSGGARGAALVAPLRLPRHPPKLTKRNQAIRARLLPRIHFKNQLLPVALHRKRLH
ncbi:MAG: type VI secretion system tip protein VgrG [Nitrosomonas sp.]|nr:type VI secretion system tip protein VgrG [Nitrosomonas sp.]